MSNMETFYNELHSYVQKIAGQIVDLNGGNPVVTGVVTQALGTYYVVKLIEGDSESSVKAITVNNNLNLSLNDSVYLIKANSTLDSTYYIIGKMESIQEAFLNVTLSERFQVQDKGSKDLTELDTTFDNDTSPLNTSIIDEVIIDTIKEKGAFQIGATFSCHKNNNEDYGVKVTLYKDEIEIKLYELNTHYFIGQPFNMIDMVQSRTIQLDETTLNSGFNKIKVTTFGDGFSYSNVKLSAGFLLNIDGVIKVAVAAINDKNYFSKNNTELVNTVQLKATVTYEGQEFAANGLQYYWLIKDDSITSTSKEYLDFVGTGWKCLNSYRDVDAIGLENTKLQLWDNKNSIITFSNLKDFPNFINTMKCVIKYQQVIAESEEFEIYNYNKESFYATIKSSITPAMLILETDEIFLTCEVDDKNPQTDMEDYQCIYKWFYSTDGKNFSELKNTSETPERVIVVDTATSTSIPPGYHEMTKEKEYFYCQVTIYNKEDFDMNGNAAKFISEENSDIFEVVSRVSGDTHIVQWTYYKYYISTSNKITFRKKDFSSTSPGLDWRIYKYEDNSWSEATWTAINKINLAGLQFLMNELKIENGSYLYFTSQTRLIEIHESSGLPNTLRYEDWTYPQLLRYKSSNGNEVSENFINQLNTLSQLTNGFTEQGVYTKEHVYWPTSDTAPQEGKTYYTLKSGATGENDDDYEEFKEIDFDESTIYYELHESKLFINAEMINTGTLTVSKEINGKTVTIFSTDIDTGNVEIAGFTVDEDSISHGDEGTDKYVYLGTDGIVVGKCFSASNSGASFTGSVSFVNAPDAADQLIGGALSYSVQQNAYNNSDEKPNKPNKEDILPSTSSSEWHTVLRLDDKWQTSRNATIKRVQDLKEIKNLNQFENGKDYYYKDNNGEYIKASEYEQEKIYYTREWTDVPDTTTPWGDVVPFIAETPYILDVENDYISIPNKYEVGISQECHFYLRQGINAMKWDGQQIQLIVDENVEIVNSPSIVYNGTKATATITFTNNGTFWDDFQSDVIIFKAKIGNNIVATATVKIVKLPADVEYVQLIVSPASIATDANYKAVTSTSFNFQVLKNGENVSSNKYSIRYIQQTSTGISSSAYLYYSDSNNKFPSFNVSSIGANNTSKQSYYYGLTFELYQEDILVDTEAVTINVQGLPGTSGTSSYFLEATNDYVSLPADKDGNILENSSQDVIFTAKYGQDILKLEQEKNSSYYIDIVPSNSNEITYELNYNTDGKAIITISKLDFKISDFLTTNLYFKDSSGNKILLASRITTVGKQIAGQNGSYIYMIASPDSFSISGKGKLKKGEVIIKVMKQTNESVKNISNNYELNNFDYDNNFFITSTKNDENFSFQFKEQQNIESGFNKTISLYTDKNNHTNTNLLDQETIDFNKDGQDGTITTEIIEKEISEIGHFYVYYESTSNSYLNSPDTPEGIKVDITNNYGPDGLLDLAISNYNGSTSTNGWYNQKYFLEKEYSAYDIYYKTKGWRGANDSGEITYLWQCDMTLFSDGQVLPASPVLMNEIDAIAMIANSSNCGYYVSDTFKSYTKELDTGTRTITTASGVWCYVNHRIVIDGGAIVAGSIEANQIAANAITADKIATDAIRSKNYDHKTDEEYAEPDYNNGGASENIEGRTLYFSAAGSYFDLSNGNLYTPNLVITSENLRMRGEIISEKGYIGGLYIDGKRLYSQNDEIGLYGGGYADRNDHFLIDSLIIDGTKTLVNLYAGLLEQSYSSSNLNVFSTSSLYSYDNRLYISTEYQSDITNTYPNSYLILDTFIVNNFQGTLYYHFSIDYDKTHEVAVDNVGGIASMYYIKDMPSFRFSSPNIFSSFALGGGDIDIDTVNSFVTYEIYNADGTVKSTGTKAISSARYILSSLSSDPSYAFIDFSIPIKGYDFGSTAETIKITKIQGTFFAPITVKDCTVKILSNNENNTNLKFYINTNYPFNIDFIGNENGAVNVFEVKGVNLQLQPLDPNDIIQYKYYPYIKDAPIDQHALYVTNEGYVHAQYLSIKNNLSVPAIQANNLICTDEIQVSNLIISGELTIEPYREIVFQHGSKGTAFSISNSKLIAHRNPISLQGSWILDSTEDAESGFITKIGFKVLSAGTIVTTPYIRALSTGWSETNKGYSIIGYLENNWQIDNLQYSTATAISSSDRNVKNSIQLQSEVYSILFDKIKPSIFKYNNGTSDRYHTGLIAQDLEQAVLEVGLTTQDFAAVCYNINENGEKINYGIRYEELVSMCIYEIQQNKTKIKSLESKVAELENLLYNNN